MLFGLNLFGTSQKSEKSDVKKIKKKNPILKEIKCENLNIWVEDIIKIPIDIFSLYNIFNKMDINQNEVISYLTPDIIDLDPYRLHYVKFLKLKSIENKAMKQSQILNLNNSIVNVEKKLGLKNTNLKKNVWVEEENVIHNIEDFISNRFYTNIDIKMFLLKFLHHEKRIYKLIIKKDKKNIIIDEGLKHFRINKKILKKIKSFMVNLKGVKINLKKSSIGTILGQSRIKENHVIKDLIFYTKHIKQNYEIMIKYHKIYYPKIIKQKLTWINDENDFSEKIKRKDIYLFNQLIENAENFYNMLIEDENRRMREFGLFVFKRSKSGDYSNKKKDIFQRIWGTRFRAFSEDDYISSDSDEESEFDSETNNTDAIQKIIEKNKNSQEKGISIGSSDISINNEEKKK